MDPSNDNTKVVLLVGGLGTRLRSVVSATPKPLALVGKRPFLELLIRQLRNQGFRQLVLCTGYLAEEVEQALGNGMSADVNIEYSKETSPMGTGGAVKLAERFLHDLPFFLVMNGDSFLQINYRELLELHSQSGGIATMAVLRLNNRKRYGNVTVDSNARVTGFVEKSEGDSGGLVNAGIYVFDHKIFNHLPEGPASLEKDIFPELVEHGVYACEQRGMFIDIGTPEDYARAQILFDQLDQVASTSSPGDGSD